MSFLEWWGESVDPGKVGTIDLSGEHEACQCRPLVWGRLLCIVIGLPVFWYLTVPRVPLPTWQSALLVIGGTLIYVAVAYLIHPQPDLKNIGPAAGMIDHPWRYSDDLNRLLLGVQCVLGPGRFIAESLLDALVLFRSCEDPQETLPTEPDWRR
ncbi:MAG: hypothetical protein JXB62_07550 [Pirellulales bacterium]|nr:hypothetical protein [Pirellulales bacterium]